MTATPSAPSTEALNKLYDTWIDCAEEAYARAAHSEAFCDALADFVNASSQWRGDLQTTVEQWAKMLDLPTRSEIDTLAQRLKSLEERLAERPAKRNPTERELTERKPKAAAKRPQRARRRAKS